MTSGMGLKPSNLPGVWEQHKKGWDSGDKGTGGWRAGGGRFSPPCPALLASDSDKRVKPAGLPTLCYQKHDG